MKEYKNSNELLDYIISKGVSVNNKEDALYKIKTYSYYSIINTYKDVFKNTSRKYIFECLILITDYIFIVLGTNNIFIRFYIWICYHFKFFRVIWNFIFIS